MRILHLMILMKWRRKMANNRLFLSLSEEDLKKLDILRGELGMNRSEYIRHLLSGQKKILPPTIRDKKLIEKLSQIDLDMRAIALKDGISPGDALAIYSEIREMKYLITGSSTSGPLVQK